MALERAAPVASTPPPAALLSLRDIAKTFPSGTQALVDLSLDVAAGDFLSLLGPSGCGKSTVLRIIAGLVEPGAGTIQWQPSGSANGGRPEIGFVFQEPTLMPWATVADNVWLPLRLKGQSRNAARSAVMDALKTVGLEASAAAYPRELSGGMQMRVSIARALVTRPKLLLMDEPFAALDEITRLRLNDELIDLWQRFGWTVIFVTHSVLESVYLSRHVVVMATKPGRLFGALDVAAPYPRGENFRTSPTYADDCRRVSETLHAAMAAN